MNKNKVGIKYAYDKNGDLVVTDGFIYVGFDFKDIPELNMTYNIDEYCEYTVYEVLELGIDKITDWRDVPND